MLSPFLLKIRLSFEMTELYCFVRSRLASHLLLANWNPRVMNVCVYTSYMYIIFEIVIDAGLS